MMRRAAVVFLSLMVFAGGARAAGNSRPSAGVPLPAEWAGIWTSVDSLYLCNTGALYKVATRTDTLCAGDEIGLDPYGNLSGPTCAGSGDATHMHTDCWAIQSGGCPLTFTTELDWTRTGDSAFGLRTTNYVWDTNCSSFNLCVITRTHSTRVASSAVFCGAVPTGTETWGRVKASYR